MNYKRIYDAIIEKAKFENRQRLFRDNKKYIYYEKHHILPRCLGGLDDEENLQLLTAKEHFICHKLLTKIYPNNLKIIRAFQMMTKIATGYYLISSRDYEYAKKLYDSIPKSEKTRKRQLEVWFEINCSEKNITKYLNSLKGVHYSPDYDKSIHIPFK